MARLLYDTTTGTLQPYPRADDEDVLDLDPRYKPFRLEQAPQPRLRPDQWAEPTEVIDITREVVFRDWVVHDPAPAPLPEPDWARFRDQMLPLFDVIIKQEIAKGNPAERAASIQLLPTYFLAERNGADEFARVWRDLTPDAKTVQFAIALATDCHLPPEFIAALTPTTP